MCAFHIKFYDSKRRISWILLTFYFEIELFLFPCQHWVLSTLFLNRILPMLLRYLVAQKILITHYFFFRNKSIHRFFDTFDYVYRTFNTRTQSPRNLLDKKTKTKTSYDWWLVVHVFSFVHPLSFLCVLISFPLHKWIWVSPCHSYTGICTMYTNQYLYATVWHCSLKWQ